MTKADAKKEALQKFHEAMRLQGKSWKTIKSYKNCVANYIDFIADSHYSSREERIGRFLTKLVMKDDVSASTQGINLNAIIRFYELVRHEDIGRLDFMRSSKPQIIPTVLSREEAWAVLDNLHGEGWLQGGFMYGCGLRLDETCSIRLMDIYLDRKQIHVHLGKGAKDRVLSIPDILIDPIKAQISAVTVLQRKYADRKVPVSLPGALDKKYPSAPFSLPWFWLFPASGPAVKAPWTGSLWHIHPNAVQKKIARAVKAAGILKHATPHTLRHSYATHWLENAEGNHEIAIIRLQKLMGHADPQTTMIYLHCVKQRTDVLSPMDTPLLKVA